MEKQPSFQGNRAGAVHQWIQSFVPFGIGQFAAFGSLLSLTRSLSAEAYGSFATTVAYYSYAVLVGSLGTKTLVLQEASGRIAAQSRLFASHSVISIAGGILAIGLSQLLAPLLLGESDAPAFANLWLGVGAWFAIVSVMPFLDAAGRQPVAQAVIAATELMMLCAIVLAGDRLDASVAAAMVGAKWAMTSLLAAAAWVAIKGWPGWTWSRDETMRLVLRGLPLLATSIVSSWPIAGTVILVRRWHGAEEAAIAGVASQTATLYLLMAGVAYRLIQPQLASEEGMDSSERSSNVLVVVWMMIGAWCVMLGAVVAMFLLVLPEHYRVSTTAGTVMMVSALFGAASYLGWAYLIARNDENAVLGSYLAGNVLFVAVAVAAIPSWGSAGAAAASCAGTAATALTMALRLRRVREY